MASDLPKAGLFAAAAAGVAWLVGRLGRSLLGGDMDPVRQAALDACADVVPSDYGDASFQEMTGGKFVEDGHSSSCGFLTSYVLLRVGCRDGQILNREVPEYGLAYHPGENISRLVAGAKALGAWRTLESDGPPEPGDLVFFSNGPSVQADGSTLYGTEHVNVFGSVQLDAQGVEYWETWDAGRKNNAGHQCARHLNALPGQGVPNQTEMRRFVEPASCQFIDGPRKIVGYVSITAVPLVPELAP